MGPRGSSMFVMAALLQWKNMMEIMEIRCLTTDSYSFVKFFVVVSPFEDGDVYTWCFTMKEYGFIIALHMKMCGCTIKKKVVLPSTRMGINTEQMGFPSLMRW